MQLSQEFIAKQKHRLEKLRDEVRDQERRAVSEARMAQGSLGNEPRDSADDAAAIARGEIDEGLVEANAGRLREIERALRKIEDGSYGLSDASGAPIPRERLEAVPEATQLADERPLNS